MSSRYSDIQLVIFEKNLDTILSHCPFCQTINFFLQITNLVVQCSFSDKKQSAFYLADFIYSIYTILQYHLTNGGVLLNCPIVLLYHIIRKEEKKVATPHR